MPTLTESKIIPKTSRGLMRANVFHAPRTVALEQKPIPRARPSDAVVEVHLTSICGTDLHIVRGEYPINRGVTLGHEAVGVIHELGSDVTGYSIGERVLISATTPCGQCEYCLIGNASQCGGDLGGWRLGNVVDGTQADFVRVPFAQANLAPVPDDLSDEQVLLLADTASIGFAAAENAGVRLGDAVAVFAQGPIGLCATLGARLLGAGEIFAIDGDAARLRMAERFGATSVILAEDDPVRRIRNETRGRGVDVGIEALGAQETFENALRVLRPGGTLSSVGIYAGAVRLPFDAIRSGLAGQKIVTTLCPGGKERMRRLMRLVANRRIDLAPLLTHVFTLDEIGRAYELLAGHRNGVLKVAIRVS